jgi:hypothetical protein
MERVEKAVVKTVEKNIHYMEVLWEREQRTSWNAKIQIGRIQLDNLNEWGDCLGKNDQMLNISLLWNQ